MLYEVMGGRVWGSELRLRFWRFGVLMDQEGPYTLPFWI